MINQLGNGVRTSQSGLDPLLGGRKSQGYQDFFRQLGLDPNGNNEVGAMLKALSAGNYQGALNRQNFNNGLEGRYQQMFNQVINQLTVDPNAQSQRASENIYANSARSQRQARAAGQGMAGGAVQGQINGMGLDAAQQASQADQYYHDPATIAANLSQALGQINNAQGTNPYLTNIMNMFAPIEQRYQQNQKEQSQGGINGVLGSVLGMAANYYTGGGFGAAKSSGAFGGGNTGGSFGGGSYGNGGFGQGSRGGF